ncbi:TPA: MBL fold metallo-hydrolase [Candidatus Falkowbacteria bacterium]|nr:MBL fold metallo-hydrolase [Candidatus Falkowbacteria bacterium]
MKLKFCGAAQNVTGSRHLLLYDNKKILLDCGLVQGGFGRLENHQMNNNFLFDPKTIDAVVLSHAHIDHAGNLPTLIRQGFKGKIYCTEPTVELLAVMLEDAAKIQAQDAEYLRKRFQEEISPLYDKADVAKTLKRLVGYKYGEPFEVEPGCQAVFYDAGHVLGSAQVFLTVNEGNVTRRIAYTGDLGRKNMPILNDPYQIPSADVLITESTYAEHLHDSFEYVFEEMEWVVRDVVARGGKIIVPGFSLERTQELIYVLHKLYLDKKIPAVPIFVDSPMSTKISEVFMRHVDYYDDQSFKDFLGRAKSPFAFKNLKYITSVNDSKKLNEYKGSCIIISASGMCTAGRIVHHLKHNIEDPRNLILIVGYMAKGTLGRRIVEQKRKVKIMGSFYNLKADVLAMNEFSAHADKLELMDNIKKIKKLKQIFIVHGEELATAYMRDNIINTLKFKGEVYAPKLGESFDL